MPDSVEQSRDANERVCLQKGLQTTVVEGLNSEEEHSQGQNSCCLPRFAPEVVQ